MKPFLVLLFPFVLVGCGSPDPVAEIRSLGGDVTLDAKSGEVVSVMLSGPQITDAGLAHLKGLPSLTWLYLGRTPITDAGLEHLKGLTSLSSLLLGGTKITDAGLAELKAALPNCEIVMKTTHG